MQWFLFSYSKSTNCYVAFTSGFVIFERFFTILKYQFTERIGMFETLTVLFSFHIGKNFLN